MDVIASEAKQSLRFHNEIATACKAGLAMTIPQITSDRTAVSWDEVAAQHQENRVNSL
jgi:hypothetical protein